ncbi:putative phosphoribosyl transferase [Nocardia transvalensis]|uniref:Putative phosphoribosyl transferase n=1 Tax=Nocardia transvalensis TaxID=37333 RepID=A0A7W9PAV6_9NOCA|nr:phosphoribosyltransferase family protein [Nocardia transvalensis]MBB5912383.1 putative phosphoribosyl transferase [Nocardia transvalensis]
MLFLDRRDAGRRLAGHLMAFRGPDIVVVGLAGGGAAVAFAVAAELRVALDIMVVHQLRIPEQPGPAFGAIAERGVRVVDGDQARALRTGATELTKIERQERDALRRRVEHLRGVGPRPELAGRTIVIVDEALAVAAPARAACRAAYAHGAIRVVVAAPIAADTAVAALAGDADKVVCLHTHDRITDTGDFYEEYQPLDDDDVRALLGREPGPALSASLERAG